jgi:hypothetical protein
MILTIAAIVMIVGVLMYALCANSKLSRIGEIMFAVGLLCVLLDVAQVIKVLPLAR